MTIEKVLLKESHEVGEAASDGSYPVVLLTPGLGSSAFYSEELIARDAPAAFPKGTHVYADHSRGADGPSVEKLLGTLIEDTTIRESDGAAINRFLPLAHRAELVKNIHKHVGMSINAGGTARHGIVDGKEVKIAESIAYHRANSVDVVSYPGREGSGFIESLIVEAFEEDVQANNAPGEQKKEYSMELEEKVDALVESLAGLVVLVEGMKPKAVETDADEDRKSAVEAVRTVEAAELPKSVKETLIESIKLGNYDVAPRIKEITDLREELKIEFTESANLGAAGASGSGAAAPKVIGWGS